MTRSLADIDLLEDTWARSVPYDQFDLLRRDAPVFWHEHPESTEGFWAVTRYDDVRAISRDHETFSAELGSTFITDQAPETLEMIRMTILNMDPPKHSRYRRLVSAGLHAAHDRPTHRPHPRAGGRRSSPPSRGATRSSSSRRSRPNSRCR